MTEIDHLRAAYDALLAENERLVESSNACVELGARYQRERDSMREARDLWNETATRFKEDWIAAKRELLAAKRELSEGHAIMTELIVIAELSYYNPGAAARARAWLTTQAPNAHDEAVEATTLPRICTPNHPRVSREDYRTHSRFTCLNCGAQATVLDTQLAVLDSVVELPDVVDRLLTQSLIYRRHFQGIVKIAESKGE